MRRVLRENGALRNAIEDGLQEYQSDLPLGPLSALAPHDRVTEARRQFAETVERVEAGDLQSRASLTKKAQRLLEISREHHASGVLYVLDYKMVTEDLKRLGVAGP